MGRKPTPPPPELELVRQLSAALLDGENLVGLLREMRDEAMRTAKRAGATGDQLGEAAGMARQNAAAIVRSAVQR